MDHKSYIVTLAMAATTAVRLDPVHASPAPPISARQSLDRIEKSAPTIHAALLHDDALRRELGDAKYADALAQLAALCETKDRECSKALRIIGDTMPRAKSKVGRIKLDGRDKEWRRALPSPDGRRWHEETEDRARDVWRHGAAGVIRDNRLFLLAGIADPEIARQPNNRMIVTIDCLDGPEWDAYLNIEFADGRWRGWCDFIARPNAPKRDPVDLQGLEVAVGKVVEIAMDIDNFAPTRSAKPIWTLYLKVRTFASGKRYHPRVHAVPVLNDSAPPGTAAAPYVRNLMYLAADVGLEKDDRTACAIAITAATIDATSDDEVRRRLRRDNAELLRFARETVAWQRSEKTDYRLDRYPLEAQVAWANRCIWLGLKYLSWNRTRDAPADPENYRWAYTTIETIRDLRKIAQEEDLLTRDVAETARRIDRWVTSKLQRRPFIGHVERDVDRYKDDPDRLAKLQKELDELRALHDSGKATVGEFKGEAIHQVFARNTGAYLDLIKTKGCFWGGCPDEAWIGQDLLRAAGIAPLALSVQPSRGLETGHCWAGYYNPDKRRWYSAQLGRSGNTWWWFQLDRVAVYPHAAMAARVYDDGPAPYPWFFKREIQGMQVERLTQAGMPTKEIRRWMFTPCW